MELSGEYLIPAPKQAVWDALNDPDVLKQCIPGCDSLEKTADNAFEAAVTAKVGPVKAKFQGAVTLSDIDAPNGYTISGEGKGGAAGFAKGGAKVTLDLRHLLRRRQARETGGGNTRGWQKPRGHNFVAPGVDSAASSRSSSVTSSSSYRRSAGSSATHRCLHSGRNQIGLPLRSRSVRNTCRVN